MWIHHDFAIEVIGPEAVQRFFADRIHHFVRVRHQGVVVLLVNPVDSCAVFLVPLDSVFFVESCQDCDHAETAARETPKLLRAGLPGFEYCDLGFAGVKQGLWVLGFSP
jgi:hypothetical protein